MSQANGANRRGGWTFRAAAPDDARAVADLVGAAYGHYIERIGMTPGPMTWDYGAVIATNRTIVAEDDGELAGVLVLDADGDRFVVDNVAVHPDHRGTGLGRALLDLAEDEARRDGHERIHLFTHEGMTENLAIYANRGYQEDERRSQGTFDLVYMSKPLG